MIQILRVQVIEKKIAMVIKTKSLQIACSLLN